MKDSGSRQRLREWRRLQLLWPPVCWERWLVVLRWQVASRRCGERPALASNPRNRLALASMLAEPQLAVFLAQQEVLVANLGCEPSLERVAVCADW